MKKFLTIMIAVMMAFSIAACGGKAKEKNNIIEYFDLTDAKILFDETIFSNSQFEKTVCLDKLIIYLKKAKKYKKLDIETFGCDNIVTIDYYNFEPQEDKLDDIEYMENFRQKLGFGLEDVKDVQELIMVIKEIERLDFVKEVQVIFAVDDWV